MDLDAPKMAKQSVILLIVMILLAGCSGDEMKMSDPNEKELNFELVDPYVENVRDGEIRWSVTGETAVALKDGRVIMTKPWLTIYENGEKIAVITGEEGEVNQARKDVKIVGEVKGVSTRGRFFANEVFWRDSKSEIYVPGNVRLVRGESVVWGREMHADPNMETVDLRDVKFNVRSGDEKYVETLPEKPEL